MLSLTAYLMVAGAFALIGLLCLVHTEDAESVRVGARILLFAPVWPAAVTVIALYLLYKLVLWLIRSVCTLFLIAFNKHPDWKKHTDDDEGDY